MTEIKQTNVGCFQIASFFVVNFQRVQFQIVIAQVFQFNLEFVVVGRDTIFKRTQFKRIGCKVHERARVGDKRHAYVLFGNVET